MGVLRFAAMAAIAAIAIPVGLGQAKADKLDDVINNGKLRCGVVLDFPPIGFRDADNNPVGFDVRIIASEHDVYMAQIRRPHSLPAECGALCANCILD